MATLWIAAITGFAQFSTWTMTCRRCGSAEAAGVLNSLMSAPPENALPAPISTIARTAASASARSSPATIPWRSAWPRPLTGGLFRVMTATSPRTE